MAGDFEIPVETWNNLCVAKLMEDGDGTCPECDWDKLNMIVGTFDTYEWRHADGEFRIVRMNDKGFSISASCANPDCEFELTLSGSFPCSDVYRQITAKEGDEDDVGKQCDEKDTERNSYDTEKGI